MMRLMETDRYYQEKNREQRRGNEKRRTRERDGETAREAGKATTSSGESLRRRPRRETF